MSRRTFFAATAAGALCTLARPASAEAGAAFANFESYADPVTGARVYILAGGDARNEVIYQTHPMWTPGMRHYIFNSDRQGGGMRLHALTMETGVVRPLLEVGPSSYSLGRDGAKIAYVHDRVIYTRDVVEAATGTGDARKAGELPADAASISGTISIDASGNRLYMGVARESGDAWALISLDLATGAWTEHAHTDFQVGHAQCHPTNPRYTLFCHETGGFADQRMWLYDLESGAHTPFYVSETKEWITHEVWWGEDQVLFTIWPYDDVRRAQPHGVALVSLNDQKRRILAHYPAWHTHGSPDGKWVMGDDFDRNLWLIHMESGERRLLTQGHNGNDFKTHPHASFSPDSRGIVFNSSRSGKESVYYVALPEWESLAPMTEAQR
jgi:oligogalacturonide lyase